MTVMKRLTREKAIAALRAKLLTLVDEDHSICEVATERGIFCGGFAQWTFHELKKQYPTIVRSRPRITPQRLRDLANRWQLARSAVLDRELACDAQMCEGKLQTCKGWDAFDDQQLAHFHQDLCGEEVEIR